MAAAATSSSISPSNRIAVVTGGNKGIGLEICRQLASSNQVLVILTARDESRGIEAVNNLIASGLADVVFHQLDVLNPASMSSFADYIKSQFGKLDILVNNAGISGVVVDEESSGSNLGAGEIVGSTDLPKRVKVIQTYETAEQCLQTNYFGVKRLTQALIPLLLLSDSARIVNISSSLGKLEYISNEWAKNALSDVDGLTEEKVEEVVRGFLEDAKEDLLEKKGWPTAKSAYKLSKAALNAYTRILAKEFPNLCTNAVTPGFVKTDINFHEGHFTVEEGAKGPVMAALMPNGGPSGRFFYQMEESTF